MTNRREFIRYTGAAALVASMPASLFAKGQQQLPRRPIPGTDESLAIIGYGNARVFREGDMKISRELMGLFLDHGGSYVDTSGNGRNTIGKQEPPKANPGFRYAGDMFNWVSAQKILIIS